MRSMIIAVNCVRYPDHGPTINRWLLPVEREQITQVPEDNVYEVNCPVCGCYEFHDNPLESGHDSIRAPHGPYSING